jgi:tRNA pseudouridine38-40 synthase
MRCFFRVEYDGTQYAGWQTQTNAVSVQSELEKAFSTIIREKCEVTGAGRTDTGVHARAQAAHIDIPDQIDISRLEMSINAVLPYDIAIYGLIPVDEKFHARYSATRRRYVYSFSTRKAPLLYKRVWMIYYPVDWNAVRREMKYLVGEHDFSAFCASGSSARTMTCNIFRAELADRDYGYAFIIEADRFLYKMVRTIVGTLVDIGRGRMKSTLMEIMESGDRKKAGETAPACGLVLDYVKYEGID